MMNCSLPVQKVIESLLLCLAIFTMIVADVFAAEHKTVKEGKWSEPATWEGKLIPTSPEDSIVISHEVIGDIDASFATCSVMSGAKFILKQKTLTISNAFNIEANGTFVNEGGTLKPAQEKFNLNISGCIFASGTVRICGCEIKFNNIDVNLSSLYSNTPEEDQLSNNWTIAGKTGSGLTMDISAAVGKINLIGNPWTEAPYFKINAEKTGKALTLKFADIPGAGFSGGYFCPKMFLGTETCPINITSINPQPNNCFSMYGSGPQGQLILRHTTVSYSKGLSFSGGGGRLGKSEIANAKILNANGIGITLSDGEAFAGNMEIKDCSRDIAVNGEKSLFCLKNSIFDVKKTEGKTISINHNNSKDYYCFGSFNGSTIHISKIPPQYKFNSENNLFIKRLSLVVDEKSECNNLSLDSMSRLENPENLLVHGEKKALDSIERGLLSCFPMDEGKGTVCLDSGARGTVGKIFNANWQEAQYGKDRQIDIFDPFLSVYWPMDEGKGEMVFNNTGFREHDGKAENCEWAEGKLGKCLKFSRENDSRVSTLDIGINNALRNTMGFSYGISFELWIRFSDLENQDIAIFPKHTLKLTNKKLLLDNTVLNFSPAKGEWYHLAYCEDFAKKTAYVYVNGEILKDLSFEAETLPFSVQDALAVKLGNGTFAGSLDELRLYSRCLDKMEVKTHYDGKEAMPPFIAEIKEKLDKVPNTQKINSAVLKFDGKTHINIPSPNLKEEFTLRAWIRPTLSCADSSILEQTVGNPTFGLRWGINDRRLFAAFSADDKTPVHVAATRSIISDNAVIKDNAWQHVALTYSLKEKKMALYLNGIKIQERVASKPVYYMGDRGMTISGCTPFPTAYCQFYGYMRDIGMYNRAFSEDEIRDAFLKTAPVFMNLNVAAEEEKCTAKIKGILLDEKTGEPMTCQVYVKSQDKYYVSQDNIYWGDNGSKAESVFVAPGTFELKTPPGEIGLKVTAGFEYFPFIGTVNAKDGETQEITVHLKRLIDMPSLAWWAGAHHEHSYGHGKGVSYDKFASSKGWQYYADAQKALGFNYCSHPAPYDGGDFKSTWTDRFICWPTVEDQICHIHAGNLPGGRDLVLTMENLIKADGQGLVENAGGDGLQAGQVAVGMALDKIDVWQASEKDWYKYLNLGFKSGVGMGSDYYFSYSLRKSMGKEYSYMPKLTWENMVEAYGNHATFITGGPLLLFNIDNKKIGDNVILPDSGGELTLSICAWSIYGINKIELIRSGTIEKTFTYDNKPLQVKEIFKTKASETCWFQLKVYGEAGEFAGSWALSSPIYIQIGKRGLTPNKDDVDYFITQIQNYRKTLEEAKKDKEIKDADKAVEVYKSLLAKPRTWLDDKPILEIPERPQALSTDPSLLLYFPFDEGKTEYAWDCSQNNYKAPLYNCVWGEGKKGKAICLNNSHVPILPLTFKNGFSLLSWIKLKGDNPIGQSPFAIGYNAYGLQIFPAALQWTWKGGSVRQPVSAWEMDRWYHLAITHDFEKGELKIYLDGALLNTHRLKGSSISGMGANLGGWGHSFYDKWDYNGMLDEFKIYDRALSLEEIKAEVGN